MNAGRRHAATTAIAAASDDLLSVMGSGDRRVRPAVAAIGAALDRGESVHGMRHLVGRLLKVGADDLALRVVEAPDFTFDQAEHDAVVSGTSHGPHGRTSPRTVAALILAGADPLARVAGRQWAERDETGVWPGSHAAAILDGAGGRRRDVLVALIRSHVSAVADPVRTDHAVASWHSGLRDAVITTGRDDHGIVDMALPIAVADDDALRLLAAVGAP